MALERARIAAHPIVVAGFHPPTLVSSRKPFQECGTARRRQLGNEPCPGEILMKVKRSARIAGLLLLGLFAVGHAYGQSRIGVPVPPLGPGPWVFDTAEQHKIRVSVVARGLSHPWAVAFLPDGGMLITERDGRLRVVRDDELDPHAISGVPQVRTDGNGGLMDVALHPQFSENGLVYLTYTKPVENGWGAPALAVGRLEGGALRDVRDLVVTEAFEGNSGVSPSGVMARSTCPQAVGSGTPHKTR